MNSGAVACDADECQAVGGRSLAVSTAFMVSQPMVLSALSLFATAYIIRVLGPTEYGSWAAAAGLTTVNSIFANLGLRPLFVRALVSRPSESRILLSEQLGVRLVLGGLAASLSVLCTIVLRYSPTVVLCTAVFGIALVCTTMWTVFGDFLQARERFDAYAIVHFFAGLVLTALSMYVVWMGGGAVALAVAYVSGPLLTASAFAAVLYCNDDLVAPALSWKSFRRLISESRSIAASQLVSMLRDRGEQLVLPKVVGMNMFGVYAGSLMPADRLNMIPDAIATVLYPRMSLSRERGGQASDVTRVVVWTSLTASAAAAVLYLAAPAIVTILMPTHVAAALRVLRILCFGVPGAGLATALGYALQAGGQERLAARLNIGVSVTSIAATVWCVLTMGITGAAIAWVGRQYLLAIALTPAFVRRYRETSFPWLRLWLASTILLTGTWMLSATGEHWIRSLLDSGALMLVFAAVAVALKLVPWNPPRHSHERTGAPSLPI